MATAFKTETHETPAKHSEDFQRLIEEANRQWTFDEPPDLDLLGRYQEIINAEIPTAEAIIRHITDDRGEVSARSYCDAFPDADHTSMVSQFRQHGAGHISGSGAFLKTDAVIRMGNHTYACDAYTVEWWRRKAIDKVAPQFSEAVRFAEQMQFRTSPAGIAVALPELIAETVESEKHRNAETYLVLLEQAVIATAGEQAKVERQAVQMARGGKVQGAQGQATLAIKLHECLEAGLVTGEEMAADFVLMGVYLAMEAVQGKLSEFSREIRESEQELRRQDPDATLRQNEERHNSLRAKIDKMTDDRQTLCSDVATMFWQGQRLTLNYQAAASRIRGWSSRRPQLFANPDEAQATFSGQYSPPMPRLKGRSIELQP